MAGFTDAACRHLMADHGAAWTVSEMASAKAITFGDDKSVRLLRDKASHGSYAVQLLGAEPETMAQAIRIIQEKACSLIFWTSTWVARPPRSHPAVQAAN